jgi:hypothetical protein
MKRNIKTAEETALALAGGQQMGVLAGNEKINGSVRFQITNTFNTGTDAKRIAFCPGDHPTAASLTSYGIVADAILSDGTILGDVDNGILVTSTKGGLTVEAFMRYISRNAFLLESMLVETTDEALFSQILDYAQNVPYAKPGEDMDIDLNEFISAFQSNGKKADIDLTVTNQTKLLNAETALIWPIPAATSAFLTLRGTFYKPVYG